MKKSQFILLVVLLAIGASGGWLLKLNEEHPAVQALLAPTPKLTSEEADFASLEQAAVDSCMCKRRSGNGDSCDAIYSDARDELLGRVYENQEPPDLGANSTSCAPVSTTDECFGFTDGVKCITTEFRVVGASSAFDHPYVCTANEARNIEAAFKEGSFEGVDAMLKQILAGERVPQIEPTGGCAG